jgi:hypothetical protein
MWYLDAYPLHSSPGGTTTLTFNQMGTHVLTAAPWSCYMSDPSPGLTIYIGYTYNVVADSTDRKITVTPSVSDTENDSIAAQSNGADTIEYTLTDKSTGDAVGSGQLPSAGGTLDFANLPAGDYTLRLTLNDGTFEEHSIVWDKTQ